MKSIVRLDDSAQRLPRPTAEETPDYEAFYEAYHQRVLHYLLRRCGSREDAEDLTSAVFTYCYQQWSHYDASRASLQSWLFMIVRSRWKNYCRDRKVFVDIDDLAEVFGDEDSELERAVMLDAIRQDVAEILLQLSENQREVIVLRYFGNLDDSEIARRMHTTSGNIRVLHSRALKKMKLLLHAMREQENI